MSYDISRAHVNNPFRQPAWRPNSTWVESGFPINGSKWLGFGPKILKVDTQVVHYGGARLGSVAVSPLDADVIATLRAMNRSSWTSRGYSLYYNFYLPTDGRLWGIRQFDWRNAANADDDQRDGNENNWTFAVHTVLQKVDTNPKSDVTVEPTWDQLETLRWLRWEAREYAIEAGNPTTFNIDLLPHRDIKPTGCPGDKMTKAIRSGILDIPSRTAPKPPPTPEPQPTDPPGGQLMITVFQPSDCLAEFMGMTDKNGNALEVKWIRTAKDQMVRDAHLKAGARRDPGPATKGKFNNVGLKGPVPVGDTYPWTADDFWYVDG